MKNFLQRGASVAVPAPREIKSGELAVIGVLAGVAGFDAAAGEAVEVHLEGVYSLPKTPAQAWAVGAAIYAVPATGLLTTASAAGNVLVGVAIEAAANPSSTGTVRLIPTARAA
ncbi:DUF2190 family protein [Ketogulonicigenium vulgare]|uniref:DUF2190 family protein n=1 Tax=Ketogulonicigenium vulgare TaxID=92945 RepID=UPI0023596DB3|nr:capsid cement protein [Ketogulonicigenium vulgare]